MQSRWSEAEAAAAVEKYVSAGINEDVAIRIYSTRLLGRDPALVLHGGGNTSVKTRVADADGGRVEVLCVKGSGWDMATIEPGGLPAVRLEPLQALVKFERLADDEMVRLERRPDRPFRAQSVGRGDPARELAFQARRSHPRQRHRLADQPATRRGADPRIVPRRDLRALRDAGFPSRQGGRRGVPGAARRRRHDPVQAWDLHVLRRSARNPTKR